MKIIISLNIKQPNSINYRLNIKYKTNDYENN